MKKFALIITLFSSLSAFSAEQCYQISAKKDVWSKTPEILCINGDVKANNFTLTLKSGLLFNQATVATFNFNLLERAKCIDCNQDLFGLANPLNSSFNALSIQFNGIKDSNNANQRLSQDYHHQCS